MSLFSVWLNAERDNIPEKLLNDISQEGKEKPLIWTGMHSETIGGQREAGIDCGWVAASELRLTEVVIN